MSKTKTAEIHEGNLFHGTLHRVQLAITSDDADTQEWQDLEFRSEDETVESALRAYIVDTFGEDVEIAEQEGALRVDDPLFPKGACIRLYKV